MSIVTTFSIRFVSRGEAFYSAIAIFISTLIGLYAIVDIVRYGVGAIWYALGIALGSYIAVKLDVKRK